MGVWRVDARGGRWLSDAEARAEDERVARAVASGELHAARERARAVGASVGRLAGLPGAYLHGAQCPACMGVCVWRGRWHCDGCGAVWTAAAWQRAAVAAGLDDGVRLPWVDGPEGAAMGAAEGAPPLFRPDIRNKSASSRSYSQICEEVELYTGAVRRRRASHHLRRASGGSAWHEQRVEGQRGRFERIRRCGELVAELRGERADTGAVESRDLYRRCDCWRVCWRCMDRRRRKLALDVVDVRGEAMRRHGWRLSPRYPGAEGRWSPKLLTLTVPHGATVGEDSRVLVRAWALFSRKMLEHFRVDKGMRKCMPVWVRALEVAHGGESGHAHMHVWMLGPYLDHVWVREYWGRALEECGRKVPMEPWGSERLASLAASTRALLRTRRGAHGRALPSVRWPVVDIRAEKKDLEKVKAKGVARCDALGYALKAGLALYAMKSDGTREDLHSWHRAQVYEALEGRRVVQWARGWAPRRRRVYARSTRMRVSDERLAAWRAGDAPQVESSGGVLGICGPPSKTT